MATQQSRQSRQSMQPLDLLTAAISGTLAAAFFTLAVVAAVPDEPSAPVMQVQATTK